ncbi:MAG: hypothetical protein HQL43_16845 [Alphaproteobacteria bacterium]|nr:hypothetical protein [Alphaproteobacteria bacterium]
MIFLDFEASGLTGFPIEVGICGVDGDRGRWKASWLIRHDEWLGDLPRWDAQAEDIHHITRAELIKLGESPRSVMTWLNGELAGLVACVDSMHDHYWLKELAQAAGIVPLFKLESFEVAFAGREIFQVADEASVQKICLRTHRAADDAEFLAMRYLLSLYPGAPIHRLFLTPDGQIERLPLHAGCEGEDYHDKA